MISLVTIHILRLKTERFRFVQRNKKINRMSGLISKPVMRNISAWVSFILIMGNVASSSFSVKLLHNFEMISMFDEDDWHVIDRHSFDPPL